ncbi:MAG TPA: SDR family oxidoreductase [Bacteroidetes bacterium]|nr:SDR family oxidoreductase [Bacteroidota bacterium]
MKKNAFIAGVFTVAGQVMAEALRQSGHYIYGTDRKEDYSGLCDRAFRFDLARFATDADYRIRFTDIFDEVIPRLDVLVLCPRFYHPGHLYDIQLEHWYESLNGQLTGPMLLCKLFQARLECSRGSVLFVAPHQELLGEANLLAYSSSMFGFYGLARALAADWKEKIAVYGLSTVTANEMPEDPAEKKYWKEIGDLAVFLLEEKPLALSGQFFPMTKKN